MDIYYEFDKDVRSLSPVKKGRAYAGQACDNCSTTLRFEHVCYDPLGEGDMPDHRAEWDFLAEGYHAYIVFNAFDDCTGYPLTYGDSSSPRFDGYSFKIPYEVTSRTRNSRVEFQLFFVKAPDFTGRPVDLAEGTEFMYSAPAGFALRDTIRGAPPGPGGPRPGHCGPMSPANTEPSLFGWVEMWKDTGLLMPIDHRAKLDPQGRFATETLTFMTYRGTPQAIDLNSPTLDAYGELPITVIKTGSSAETIPLLKENIGDGDILTYSFRDRGFIAQAVNRGEDLSSDPDALVTAKLVPQSLKYDGAIPAYARTKHLSLIDGMGRDVGGVDVPAIPVTISYEPTLPQTGGTNFIVLRDGEGNLIDYADLPIDHILTKAEYDPDHNELVLTFATQEHEAYDVRVPLGDLMVLYEDDGTGPRDKKFIDTVLVKDGDVGGANTRYRIYLNGDFWSEIQMLDSEVAREAADALAAEVADRKAADGTLQRNIDSANAALNAHTTRVDNPHSVTKAQVGLGSVENIAPADMPLSDAAIAANTSVRTEFKQADTEMKALLDAKDAEQDRSIENVAARVASLETEHRTDHNVMTDNSKQISKLNDQVAALNTEMGTKQGILTAGENISISSDGVISSKAIATVDTALDLSSTNPVTNAAVTKALSEKQRTLTAGTNITITPDGTISSSPAITVDSKLDSYSTNPVENRAVTEALFNRKGGISNWAEGATYTTGDVVQYDFTLYISKADDNDKAPTDPDCWVAVHGGTFTPGAITLPSYIGLFGNDTDTEYTITHKLGCRELVWSMYTNDTEHLYINATVSAPTLNTFRIRFSEPPGDNRVVISIIRARTTAAASTTLNGPTVVEFGNASNTWTYTGNDTGQPVFVQAIAETGGVTTDIVGDIIQNSAELYNPVTVWFGKPFSGHLVVAPADACFDMDGTSLVIEKTAENGLEPGAWYLVQCYRDDTGESVLDVIQSDSTIDVSTGGAVWQGQVCLYKATVAKDFSTDDSTQEVSYQHNQGRYVGVQAYDLTDGLCGTTVDYDTVNKVTVTVGPSHSGKLLVL